MKKFLQNLFKKENPVGWTMMFGLGYSAPRRDLKAYATEGYCQNVVVFRCINEIARGCASIPLELHRKKPGPDGKIEIVKDHPMLDLISRPNPSQTRGKFISQLATEFLYAGNAYVAKVGPQAGTPRELWLLNPQKVTVKPGRGGMPREYEYRDIGGKVTYPVDGITGKSDVLHFKEFNPNDHWYGMSRLEAAAWGVDIHNQGMRFNKSLLDNGARPSGLLWTEGTITDASYLRLKEWKEKAFQGAANAGEVPLLDNGLKWQELGLSPKDLDFGTGMDKMAMYIAAAYGVPFPLVISDAATFNNMKDAREALYENTILPLLADLCETLSMWLSPYFGDEYTIVPNPDGVSALEGKRERKFNRMADGINKGLVTPNEGREEIGSEPVEGGDVLLVPSNLIPLDLAGISGGPDPQATNPSADPNASGMTPAKALLSVGYSRDQVVEILKSDFGEKVS